MNDQHELEIAIRSRFPILVLETYEERRVLDLIRRTCLANEWGLFVWDLVDGLERRDQQVDRIGGTSDPDALLRHLLDTPHDGIYVLLDFAPHLEDHAARQRTMKRIVQAHDVTARTLVLVGHEIALPPDLRRLSARLELAMPDIKRVKAILSEELDWWKLETGEAIRASREAVELMVRYLAGLCQEDVRRLIRQSLRRDGAITLTDLERIQKTKYEMLGANGLLSMELDTGRMADIGGLAALKRWLELRREAFVGDTIEHALVVPKGILLLGVQGAGKSLAAKCVAGAAGLPLLQRGRVCSPRTWAETSRTTSAKHHRS